MKKINIALAGNPNCGKTTIFNALTRSRHKTGNYPGVTVEKKEGSYKLDDIEINVIDLPGTYSLTTHSEEEVIARNYILDEKPDVIVNIIDATHIERSLYLTTQLMELEVPIILVCNKVDLSKIHGIEINFQKLSNLLEAKIVPTIGTKKEGIKELLKQIQNVFKQKDASKGIYLKFSEEIEDYISKIENLLEDHEKTRWLAIKLLESDIKENKFKIPKQILSKVESFIFSLQEKYKKSIAEIIAEERHRILAKLAQNITIYEHKLTISDRIDKVVTNKYLGIFIFLLIMFLTFQFTFSIGVYPTVFLQNFFQKLSYIISSTWQSDSLIRSLLVDGIIGGVGTVLVFVPNILLLFIVISFLEESGYMVRAAYVMDRIMHKIGLHGRSFLPMLIGFGCTVPAIMATRILENRRDRITTIFVLPLISCSAKLAVFTLLIPAFFSAAHSAYILFSLYVIGILLAIFIIRILRKTIFKGENIPFIMDMPAYQFPSFKNIFFNTWQKAGVYVKKAGTFILAISIILWFLSVFPHDKMFLKKYKLQYSLKQKEFLQDIQKLEDKEITIVISKEFVEQSQKQEFIKNYKLDLFKNKKLNQYLEKSENKKKLEEKIKYFQTNFNREAGILKQEKNKHELYNSYMGKIGRSIEPIFRPLGFDWRIDTALIGAISAKEIFISQLGIIFAVGEENDDISLLQNKLKQNYSSFEGLCILLFLLISAPCIATIAMTKKEISTKWALMQLGFLTVLAYILTLFVYQIGNLF